MYERQPNTIYVASLSYGKDSIAMLEAIKQLGMPLDRIVHAEVWATDDIPADLPPMVEFKKYADKVIKERYGVEVEHTCAMRKRKADMSLGGGQKDSLTNDSSTVSVSTNNSKKKSCTDSPAQEEVGVKTLKLEVAEWEKVTYEKLFYHVPKRKSKAQLGGGNMWLPNQTWELVYETQDSPNSSMEQLQDSHWSTDGVRGISSNQLLDKWHIRTGFPARHRQWCNGQLKATVLDKYKRQMCFLHSPRTRGKRQISFSILASQLTSLKE